MGLNIDKIDEKALQKQSAITCNLKSFVSFFLFFNTFMSILKMELIRWAIILQQGFKLQHKQKSCAISCLWSCGWEMKLFLVQTNVNALGT